METLFGAWAIFFGVSLLGGFILSLFSGPDSY